MEVWLSSSYLNTKIPKWQSLPRHPLGVKCGWEVLHRNQCKYQKFLEW